MTLIPGDGTGPELTAAARRVLDATGVELEWSEHDIGLPAYRETGDPLPRWVVESIRRDGVALKGPVSTPKTGEFRSVNIELRRSLDLFAQVRPCKSFVGAFSPFPAVDVVVVREASEDLYAGIEYEGGSEDAEELVRWLAAHDHASVRPGAAIAVKPISDWASRRIFRFAFEYARAHGRRRVTAVHKATVMKHTDGIFVHAARELAGEYPDLVVDDISVDTLCLHLVRKPESSTSSWLPTSTPTSSPTLPPVWSAGWGSRPEATTATRSPSSRRRTARLRDMPAGASRIRSR